MKNKKSNIAIIILIAIVVEVLVVNYRSTKIDNREKNPYKYDIEEYKIVDSSLIHYREKKQIKIDSENLHAIAYKNDFIYLLHDSVLKIIDANGHLKSKFNLGDKPQSITISDDENIIIAFKNYIKIYSPGFSLKFESSKENNKAVFTSIANFKNKIFVADAGNRRVIIYNRKAIKQNEFEGKSNVDSKHGFIIPSPYFDLAINSDNELWLVNPGKHQFENYSFNGDLIRFWEKTSMTIQGFSGCCNPAHFCFLPNGDFVTSEKGMVRIKVHFPSGELKSVVAAPSSFTSGKHAPDICCDKKGNIFALDYDISAIRIFEELEIIDNN